MQTIDRHKQAKPDMVIGVVTHCHQGRTLFPEEKLQQLSHCKKWIHNCIIAQIYGYWIKNNGLSDSFPLFNGDRSLFHAFLSTDPLPLNNKTQRSQHENITQNIMTHNIMRQHLNLDVVWTSHNNTTICLWKPIS